MAAIAKAGDPTTTRGIVLATSPNTRNHGTSIAWHGDKSTCGICQGGPYPIVASGTHMRNKGRAVVVHGDWVLCPCKKNRVIAMSTNMNYGDRGSSQVNAASQSSLVSSTGTTTAQQNSKAHALGFAFTDEATGVPLRRQPVRLVVDGKATDTTTDDQGYVALVYTGSKPQRVDCHILGIDQLQEEATHG
jgi:uncharacterized Zn-binding protein involved in type VI secretion